jgi:uncharacterized protein (TIGR02271 family)
MGGGATGAAIGTAVAGPLGTAIGAVIGAFAGGLAGKGVAEAIDPTAEDAYWRENHEAQPFAQKRSYEEYSPAYRAGYEGYTKHGHKSAEFHEVESELRKDYETQHAANAGTAAPAWDEAKHAAKAAWTRVANSDTVRVPVSEEQVSVGKREVEKGAVRIRKEVHTEVVNQPVELKREEVIVERVAPGTPGSVPADAFEAGEIRIPVRKEEAVVQKTATVTGEVRLHKHVEHETKNVQATVRKETVHVEEEERVRRDVDK